MHTLPMHGFQPDRTKTGLLSKKLYRSSILFSDKEATGRCVSHNKEAGQTVKTQHFLKANKKGEEHSCIAYIPILDRGESTRGRND